MKAKAPYIALEIGASAYPARSYYYKLPQLLLQKFILSVGAGKESPMSWFGLVLIPDLCLEKSLLRSMTFNVPRMHRFRVTEQKMQVWRQMLADRQEQDVLRGMM